MGHTGAGVQQAALPPHQGQQRRQASRMAGEAKATFVAAEGWAGLSGDLAPVL